MADSIVPMQIRAARALLDWSMIDLAKAARLSISTVKRAEDEHPSPGADRSVALIRNAFEERGVLFLPDDGNGLGLRYKPVGA